MDTHLRQLDESATISQVLKHPNLLAHKALLQEQVKHITGLLENEFQNFPSWPPRFKEAVTKWLLYRTLQRGGFFGGEKGIHTQSATVPLKKTPEEAAYVVAQGKKTYAFYAADQDFIAASINDPQMISKFNTVEYDGSHLRADSQVWHAREAEKAKGKGAEGRTLIQFKDGWKWVSLDKGYCEQEGKAAGHCGNINAKEGDNILSLRDPSEHVHATFVVNNGILGEMKGRGNEKPAQKYHKYILALLKHKLITGLGQASYLPQNNFHPKDFEDDAHKEEFDKIAEKKPAMKKWDLAYSGKYETLEKYKDLFPYAIENRDGTPYFVVHDNMNAATLSNELSAGVTVTVGGDRNRWGRHREGGVDLDLSDMIQRHLEGEPILEPEEEEALRADAGKTAAKKIVDILDDKEKKKLAKVLQDRGGHLFLKNFKVGHDLVAALEADRRLLSALREGWLVDGVKEAVTQLSQSLSVGYNFNFVVEKSGNVFKLVCSTRDFARAMEEEEDGDIRAAAESGDIIDTRGYSNWSSHETERRAEDIKDYWFGENFYRHIDLNHVLDRFLKESVDEASLGIELAPLPGGVSYMSIGHSNKSIIWDISDRGEWQEEPAEKYKGDPRTGDSHVTLFGKHRLVWGRADPKQKKVSIVYRSGEDGEGEFGATMIRGIFYHALPILRNRFPGYRIFVFGDDAGTTGEVVEESKLALARNYGEAVRERIIPFPEVDERETDTRVGQGASEDWHALTMFAFEHLLSGNLAHDAILSYGPDVVVDARLIPGMKFDGIIIFRPSPTRRGGGGLGTIKTGPRAGRTAMVIYVYNPDLDDARVTVRKGLDQEDTFAHEWTHEFQRRNYKNTGADEFKGITADSPRVADYQNQWAEVDARVRAGVSQLETVVRHVSRWRGDSLAEFEKLAGATADEFIAKLRANQKHLFKLVTPDRARRIRSRLATAWADARRRVAAGRDTVSKAPQESVTAPGGPAGGGDAPQATATLRNGTFPASGADSTVTGASDAPLIGEGELQAYVIDPSQSELNSYARRMLGPTNPDFNVGMRWVVVGKNMMISDARKYTHAEMFRMLDGKMSRENCGWVTWDGKNAEVRGSGGAPLSPAAAAVTSRLGLTLAPSANKVLAAAYVEEAEDDDDDYRIQHRAPGRGRGSPLHDVTDTYPPDIYDPAVAARYYGTHAPYDHESIWHIHAAKGKPHKRVTVYRAIPKVITQAERIADLEDQLAAYQRRGNIPDRAEWHDNSRAGKSKWYDSTRAEIDKLKAQMAHTPPKDRIGVNPGDWVSLTKAYAQEHGRANCGGRYRILKKTVPARHLYTMGDSIHEWGYDPSEDDGGDKKEESVVNEDTVSQTIKKHKGDLPSLEYAMDRLDYVLESAWWKEAPPRFREALAKWLIHAGAVYRETTYSETDIRNGHAESYKSAFNRYAGWLLERGAVDYLAANTDNAQLISRFNDTQFLPVHLLNLVNAWHATLKTKGGRRKGAPGKAVLSFDDGFKWVSLGRGYCEQEGKAGGHCGNSAHREGDNILSLRDPDDNVVLTFVVNNRKLGEMKGYGNSKPAKKYHKYIVALLHSDLVDSTGGPSYLPDQNFSVRDLPDKEQRELIKKKPALDWVAHYDHLGDAVTDADVTHLLGTAGGEKRDILLQTRNVKLMREAARMNMGAAEAVALNPHAPNDLLDEIATDEVNWRAAWKLVHREHVSPELFIKASARGGEPAHYTPIAKALVSNDAVPKEAINNVADRYIANDRNAYNRQLLQHHDQGWEEFLEKIATHPHTPAAVLWKLAHGRYYGVTASTGGATQLAAERLRRMSDADNKKEEAINEDTVSQWYKKNKDKYAETYTYIARQFEIGAFGDWYKSAPAEFKSVLAKRATLQVERLIGADGPLAGEDIRSVAAQVVDGFGTIEDFLAAHVNDATLRSQLNNPAFSWRAMVVASDRWHAKLAEKPGGKGAPGRTIIQFKDGYKWVSLDRGYCEQEGKAGRHCGNSANRRGDNILSLRDPDDNVCATFVVNKGVLGEKKGVANKKPDPKYHEHVMALLQSDYVKRMNGPSYSPENDFSLDDLTQEQRDAVLAKNPLLQPLSYFNREDADLKLLRKLNDDDLTTVAEECKNPKVLEWIVHNNMAAAFQLVVYNPHTPNSARLRILEDFEHQSIGGKMSAALRHHVYITLARQPSASPEVIRKLLDGPNHGEFVYSTLARNAVTPADVQMKIAKFALDKVLPAEQSGELDTNDHEDGASMLLDLVMAAGRNPSSGDTVAKYVVDRMKDVRLSTSIAKRALMIARGVITQAASSGKTEESNAKEESIDSVSLLESVKEVNDAEIAKMGLIGPFYHGTTEAGRAAIAKEGFKASTGLSSREGGVDARHGFSMEGWGVAGGNPPPVHFLGYGVYLTQSKASAKRYNENSGKGLVEYYIDAPRLAEINFAAPHKMMAWWMQHGYDFDKTAKHRHVEWVRATQNLTDTLKKEYDAVLFTAKSIRGPLLDGNQICVFDPSRIYIRNKDKDRAEGTVARGDRVQIKGTNVITMIRSLRPVSHDFTVEWDKATGSKSAYYAETNLTPAQIATISAAWKDKLTAAIRDHKDADGVPITARMEREGMTRDQAIAHYVDYLTDTGLKYNLPSSLIAKVLKKGERLKLTEAYVGESDAADYIINPSQSEMDALLRRSMTSHGDDAQWNLRWLCVRDARNDNMTFVIADGYHYTHEHLVQMFGAHTSLSSSMEGNAEVIGGGWVSSVNGHAAVRGKLWNPDEVEAVPPDVAKACKRLGLKVVPGNYTHHESGPLTAAYANMNEATVLKIDMPDALRPVVVYKNPWFEEVETMYSTAEADPYEHLLLRGLFTKSGNLYVFKAIDAIHTDMKKQLIIQQEIKPTEHTAMISVTRQGRDAKVEWYYGDRVGLLDAPRFQRAFGPWLSQEPIRESTSDYVIDPSSTELRVLWHRLRKESTTAGDIFLIRCLICPGSGTWIVGDASEYTHEHLADMLEEHPADCLSGWVFDTDEGMRVFSSEGEWFRVPDADTVAFLKKKGLGKLTGTERAFGEIVQRHAYG